MPGSAEGHAQCRFPRNLRLSTALEPVVGLRRSRDITPRGGQRTSGVRRPVAMRRDPLDTVIPWKVPGPFDIKQKPPAAGQARHTVITEHLFQHKQARVSFGRGTGWRGREKPEGASFRRKGLVAGEGGGKP